MEYTIRRSTKAKKLRLSLNAAGELTLVLPRFVPAAAGHLFVKQNWAWVVAHRQKLKPVIPIHSYQDFETGFELTLFDQKYCSISVRVSHSKTDYFELRGDTLFVFLRPVSSKTEALTRKEKIKTLIEDFYRDQAREYLTVRSQFYADKLGVRFNGLRIKNTISRWGSCSTKKNLNYNWRIMVAPKEVIDYLVIHEVCHLKEMNHSPKFWALVESLDPDFKVHKKWLKDNQVRLHSFLQHAA